MPELNPLTIILMYMAVFAFLLFLIVFGEVQGGEWQTVARDVTKFSLLIVGFITAIFVIVGLAGRR